ncbi:hypothetical protein PGQ11_007863 [Apiospora arundinis]|uniref:Uncharacterized protein n=1 Tax=Apiospora arundinis TaxID=335852 RepID=A0ABR2IWQ2_9PEZI
MMSNANTNQVSVMNNYEDTVNKVAEMLNTNENQQADTMENSNKSPEPTPTKPARKNPLDAARCVTTRARVTFSSSHLLLLIDSRLSRPTNQASREIMIDGTNIGSTASEPE